MSWLVRADLLVLGLLFVYAFAIVIEIAHRYSPTSSDRGIDRAAQAKLAVELRIRALHLDAIATVAPYLGLLGTCLGILSTFADLVMQRLPGLAALILYTTEALEPSAVGIVLAIAATLGKHYAGRRLELVENETPRQKHPPMQRLTLPSFGIIAAYALVIVFRAYTWIAPSPSWKGHGVGIASVRCGSLDRSIVVRISSDRRFFLNLEEVKERSTLENRLSEIYRMRQDRVVYLLADEGVDYQTVADTIDALGSLDITVQLITPNAMNAVCPAPVRRKRLLASFE